MLSRIFWPCVLVHIVSTLNVGSSFGIRSRMDFPIIYKSSSLRLRGGSDSDIDSVIIPNKIKLTYFNIEGAAEKVRLAMKIAGINFEDERIDFATWKDLKPKTPFGQLPLLTLNDGEPISQSFAMLRYVGRLGRMYPTEPTQALLVDEVCGLQEDFAKALAPSVYIGMRPHLFGYPENLPEEEKKAIQMRLRETLMAKDGDIPRFLGYFDHLLEKHGGNFICGKDISIADCTLLPQLRQLKSGRLDGIPTTVVDNFPRLSAYYNRLMGHPVIKAHYEA